MMQISEKYKFPPFRPRVRAAKEPVVELGRLRLSGQSIDHFSVARECTSTSSE